MCQTLSAKCSETQCADVCSKAKDQYDACDLTDKQVPDEFMWKCTAPALAPGSPAAQAGQSYTCFVPPEAKFCDPACSAFWQKAKRGLGPAADKFIGILPGEEDCAAAESVEGCCGKGAYVEKEGGGGGGGGVEPPPGPPLEGGDKPCRKMGMRKPKRQENRYCLQFKTDSSKCPTDKCRMVNLSKKSGSVKQCHPNCYPRFSPLWGGGGGGSGDGGGGGGGKLPPPDGHPQPPPQPPPLPGGACGRLEDCAAGQEETEKCIDRAKCSCDQEKICANAACKCKSRRWKRSDGAIFSGCHEMCKRGNAKETCVMRGHKRSFTTRKGKRSTKHEPYWVCLDPPAV